MTEGEEGWRSAETDERLREARRPLVRGSNTAGKNPVWPFKWPNYPRQNQGNFPPPGTSTCELTDLSQQAELTLAAFPSPPPV